MASITFLPLPAPIVPGGSSPEEKPKKDTPAVSPSPDEFIKAPATVPASAATMAGALWTHPVADLSKEVGPQAIAGPGDEAGVTGYVPAEIRISTTPHPDKRITVVTNGAQFKELLKGSGTNNVIKCLIVELPDGSFSLRFFKAKDVGKTYDFVGEGEKVVTYGRMFLQRSPLGDIPVIIPIEYGNNVVFLARKAEED